MRRALWSSAAAAAALLLGAPPLGAAQLDEARIFIEFNSTDRDVGVHVFLDAEQWKRMKIFDPTGRKIFHVEALQTLGSIGLSELFFEGSEPSLDELPLEEFLELFPEGEYKFEGKTVDGVLLRNRVEFSHAIPDGPVIVSPEEGEEVDPEDVKIEWEPVTTPAGIEIAGYEVIVGSFDVIVSPETTSLTVPPEVLEPGTEYGFEILAIEESGNQTITSSSFVTE